MSTVIGIAENLHDSCLTVVRDGEVAVHVELERVLRRRRAVFSGAAQLAGLLSWIEDRYQVLPPAAIGIARHAVEPMTGELGPMLAERYPDTIIEFFEHLDCHAAVAAYSGVDDCGVLAIDGGGDRRISAGRPNALLQFVKVGERREPQLLDVDDLGMDGRVWALLSFALFHDLHAAGKTMGLAAYGEPDERASAAIDSLVRTSLRWRPWHHDEASLRNLVDTLPLDGFAQRANAAFAVQQAFSSAMQRIARSLEPSVHTVILAGGCALNVVANTDLDLLLAEASSGAVWVPPCPGDEGLSLGAAALAAAVIGEHVSRAAFPFLGLGDEHVVPPSEIRHAAELLARGGVLVTAVGRSEIGPRALGNRSFLALPSIANKRRVSEQMKHREPFRPVAPAVRAEDASQWLDVPIDSPFMSFTAAATAAMREHCPGAVHVDGTARHQTVNAVTHPTLYALLDDLARRGVAPVLLNTSLNVAGSPICLDGSDALATALATGADGILTSAGFTRFG